MAAEGLLLTSVMNTPPDGAALPNATGIVTSPPGAATRKARRQQDPSRLEGPLQLREINGSAADLKCERVAAGDLAVGRHRCELYVSCPETG